MDLKNYGQEHLLQYENSLDKNQKNKLLNDIEQLDFELINGLQTNQDHTKEKGDIKPLTPVNLDKETEIDYFYKGLEKIKEGAVAVVLMAGGQGTRLGHEGPKGTYKIGIKGDKSLFHIQSDKLNRLYDLTDSHIYWYIMTSEDNHNQTISHFEAHNYFGYSKKHIIFFKQDRMPLVLDDGRIAMNSPYEINFAAIGNGGVFSSLGSNHIIDHMEKNKIEWVYLYGVDNVLARVADPVFLQFAISEDKDIASKSVDKIHPDEKVGVICYRDQHPDIVEYSEINESQKTQVNEHNQLVYRNGNILQHYFKFNFLKKCIDKSLPYHLAHKKVNHYQDQLIIADKPNGYKFELFMFDVFKSTNDMAVLSVKREEEFAPVKNKDGKDSPLTAKILLLNLYETWIKNKGLNLQADDFDGKKSYMGE